MYTKNPFLIFCVVFLVCVFTRVTLAQDWESQSKDWAYECGAEARKIYTKKKIQIPCKRIGELLNKGDIQGVYIAIRDAALFGGKTCNEYIKKNLDKLKRTQGVKDAVAFYSYKNGDPSGLKLLADSYDKEAQKIGDH
jgi:hypothetical protein